jgi:hypothetical protein
VALSVSAPEVGRSQADDLGDREAVEGDEGAGSADIEWQLFIVQAPFEALPAFLLVQHLIDLRPGGDGDAETVAESVARCPDEEVADVVALGRAVL